MIGYISTIRDNSYGFISVDHDDKEYFFHKSALTNCTIFQLAEGDVVEFTTGKSHDGRDRATNVRKKYQAAEASSIANPGIHPDVILEHFNGDEASIVNFFKDVFYVTSGGKEFNISESTYKYFLIKPTEGFVRTFQLSREIVVVFSDYVCFEPRSLDAASYVYKTIDSKLRLDRGCHVLVCHDDQVESKLSTLLKDNNVNQIVIPFTYRELLSKEANSRIVEERFRKYLFDTDLFSVSAPIQNDVFFFGRRDYVHDIVSKCKNNVHCGVFGLRRSGKTSLLYAVQSLLLQQSYRTVFIPCESDLSNLDWRTALCKVVLNVYQSLDMSTSNIHEQDYRSVDTTILFEKDMHKCLKSLSLPITIMFDEIEAITFGVPQGEKSNNLWIDGDSFINFWNTIKGFYSKYPKAISILIAGTNPMINEIPTIGDDGFPNPMFRQLSESNQGAYLPAFTIEDTKNMVLTLGGYMGLSFDDYSISKLTSDCGGHPFLMRILCSYINKYIRSNNTLRPLLITKAVFDKAALDFEKSSEAISFFWMILNILMTNYPKEFNTLKILSLEGDAIIAQIQESNALFHLIGYGLVDCNQDNYAIKYNIISRFLRGEYRYERQGLSLEEQKEEIQLRINSAEMNLRKLVKNTLHTKYGMNAAKKIVIVAMEKNKAISDTYVKKALMLSYSQLFDASRNKMYFSLLKCIILENSSVFSNIFEEQEPDVIRRKLEAINTARRCPDHAYTENAENWSWESFMQFRDGITWLEKILSNFE